MVKVRTDVNGNSIPCEIYLDSTEKANYDNLNQFRQKKWDVIGLVTGEEGNGKTFYGVQRCLYMDHEFNIERIVFNEEQFLKIITEVPNNSAIMWDESDALGEHWASTIISTLKKVFKRIRKKNLFILLVTPTLFDLNKYFVIHRVRFMVDIRRVGLQRGFFSFYNKDGLRKLILEGKKMWDMKVGKPSFIGRFTSLPKLFPVDMSDEGEYELKKDEATALLANEQLNPRQLAAKVRGETYRKLLIGLKNDYGIEPNNSQLGRWFGNNYKTIMVDRVRESPDV